MSKKIKLSNITPDDKNNNKHTAYGMDLLEKSVNKVGIIESITVSNDDKIISGNARHEVIGKHFEKEALVIETDGTQPIVIKRTDIESNTKEFYEASILANTTSKKNIDFDMEVIDALVEEYDIDAVDLGVDLVEEIPEAQEDDFNGVPPKEAISVLGDLYELGEHRVLCGDSTCSETVGKLMNNQLADVVVTDPPYNTGMKENKDEKARLSHMFNDSFTDTEWSEFLTAIFNNYSIFTKGECALYVFIDWRRVSDIKNALEVVADVKNVIVWDKGVHGLGSDYKSTYENCVVGKKGKPEINNRFGLDYQDIWRVQRAMGRIKEHATQKPIELISKPIQHASKQDDIVFDLFLGSGTTLIASDQLNRKCYGMELDPKYVDVIVARYINHKGTGSNLIIKRNGQQLSKAEIKKYIENTSEAK
jgi:DNA modification methylase